MIAPDAARPIQCQGGTPPTILLVDDDEVDVRATRRALGRRGVGNRVVVAKDGVDALDLLRGDTASQLDPANTLMLLDLNMPRMNGIELLREIRSDSQLCGLVVFVISTSDAPDDIRAAYEQQAAGYLLKNAEDGTLETGMDLVRSFLGAVRFPSGSNETH